MKVGADALATGERLGMERGELLEILMASSASSFGLGTVDKFEPGVVEHVIGLLGKDVDLLHSVVEDRGIEHEMVESVAEESLSLLRQKISG
jgi:3-hydroxyisobutyrate dehydrogenase-like beta-hydroxyacid dehydrogenase